MWWRATGRLDETRERERGTGEVLHWLRRKARAGVVVLLFFARALAPFRNSARSFLPQLRDRRPFLIGDRRKFGQ